MLTETVRRLRRHPAFPLTAILLLGLGLGTCAVVFSTVDALVLDPFPYPQAGRLVVIGTEMPELGLAVGFFERLSGPELEDLGTRLESLGPHLGFDLNSVRYGGHDFPLRLFAGFCWQDPFPTLGVEPQLGRGFLDEEVRQGAAVALLAHGFWTGPLGADRNILGKTVVLDGRPHEVVGVLPPGTSPFGVDAWVPMEEPAAHLERSRRQFNLLARLAEGSTLKDLEAELDTIATTLAAEHGSAVPEYQRWRLLAMPWNDFSAFSYRSEALLTLGAVALVLLLVCANLAHLLLSHILERRQEAAVRFALGAQRRHLVALVLGESTLLAGGGALLGLAFARFGIALVGAGLPGALQPSGKALALDSRTLLFLALAALVTALAVGLLPALRLAAGGFGPLRAGGLQGTGDARIGSWLVGIQVAFAVVLLSATALLVSGYLALTRTDLGFPEEDLLSMRLTLPRMAYANEAIPPFFDQLTTEAETLPGVESASLATQLPPFSRFGGELHLQSTTETSRVLHTAIGDHYFETLGIPILRGRAPGPEDRADGPVAVVIDELAAQRFFPGRDPLGSRVRVVGSSFDTGEGEIVGIVHSVKNRGPLTDSEPEVFTHHRQAGGRYNQLFLVLRSATPTDTLLPAVRRKVAALDPEQPVYSISTPSGLVANQLAPRRVAASVLSAFSFAALALAALGIYSAVSAAVARRRREMGLRLALGADREDILSLVIRRALGPVLWGLLAGVLLLFGLYPLFAASSLAAAPVAPGPLIVTPGVLLLAALIACWGPALRAARVDPNRTLRQL